MTGLGSRYVKSKQHCTDFSGKLLVWDILFYVAICAFGIVLAIQDLKLQSVSFLSLLAFFVFCATDGIFHKNYTFIPVFIFLLIGLTYRVFKGHSVFGMADYIVVSAVSFLLNSAQVPFFIILCGVLGVITSFVLRQRRFPFIPAILVSTLLTKILT